MARAYCLTCNEQVVETPSGTCPLGHPVAAHEPGPEPWVGFAGDTVPGHTEVATDEADVPDQQLARVDVHGRVHAHAGVNGHANGAVNGHAASLPTSDVGDDLSALLAEALGSADAPTEAAPPVASSEADTAWATDHEVEDDLASLAAELQLGDDLDSDDGPATVAPADVDDLLAELTGGVSQLDSATALFEDPTPFGDAPPPADDVPSAPTAEPVDIWAEAAAEVPTDDDVPVDEAPAPRVDLSNFTARGKRVGSGEARPAKKKRKWKR